ncbi:hypothetical protein [Nocardia stercoris]|uniref:hypothetical protein n=1 Tax=Nocardia stercoris TaxID=2483361 RepID=UPI001F45D3FF|nr:hypothetical protein [Nocardia stercoris]
MTVHKWASIVAATAVTMTAAVGCAAPGSELEAAEAVRVQQIGAAIREPVYSYRDHVLLGLTDDRRIARIDVSSPATQAPTAVSAPFSDLGSNLVISPLHDTTVLVARPERGQVAAVDIGNLSETGAFEAGPAPS